VRVRNAWVKFKELAPVLTCKGSLKVKREVYNMVYGSETWLKRLEDMQRFKRVERLMIRLMGGVSLKNIISGKELNEWMSGRVLCVDELNEWMSGRVLCVLQIC